MYSKFDIGYYLEECRERLSRLCINLCSNRHDAEDLFQDTCLRAVKYFKKYNRDMDFEKWIFRICVNTYRTNLKRKNRYKTITFETTYEYDLFFSCIPENEHQHDERYRDLLIAVNKLPEKYRTILIMRYFNDYSEEETAKIVGIPKGTVKSRLSKAKKIIREVIECEECNDR